MENIIKDTNGKPIGIAFNWLIDDVQNMRPELTDDESMKVLIACGRYHDANQGMNWDTIEFWANELFGIARDIDDAE